MPASAVAVAELTPRVDGVVAGLPVALAVFDMVLGDGYEVLARREDGDRLVAGEPLRTICRDPDMPSRSTVHTWMRLNPEWAQAMACARDLASWAAADAQMAAWGYGDGIANFPRAQTPRPPVLPGS